MSAWFDEYGCDVVTEGLVVGAVPRDADDVAVLRGLGVTRVVSLVAVSEYEDGELETVAVAYEEAGIVATGVPSVDFAPLSATTIEAASGSVADGLQDGATVYLHCRAGWQRSVVTAAATLCRRTGCSPTWALGLVRERRPQACPLPHQVEDLGRWWTARGGAEAPR